MSSHQWKLKSRDEVCLMRPNCSLLSVVVDGKVEMDCILKILLLIFSKFPYLSLRQNQKCSGDYSSCKKMIDVLVLNFKAVFSAWVKVRKNDFCIGLTGEQQMCRHWASLIFVNEDEHVGHDHENDDLMTMVISLMIMINLTVLECSINEWKWFVLVLAAACGGTLTATSGNITSPSYPENYPKNKRCLWKISGPKGQTVSFQFHEFQLEGAANGVSLSVWLMSMMLSSFLCITLQICHAHSLNRCFKKTHFLLNGTSFWLL